MKWYKIALSKYGVIAGRARRREFWMFHLFNFIIYLVLSIAEMKLGIVYYLSLPFMVIMIIPTLTVAIRRLHDNGKSGKWLLVSIVPIVGILTIIYFAITEGDEGENRYGADPKA